MTTDATDLKGTAVFSVTVSVARDSLKIPVQLFPKLPLTPYQLLVVGLMGRVTSELTRMKLSPRIMFVFDEHNDGSRLERALDVCARGTAKACYGYLSHG